MQPGAKSLSAGFEYLFNRLAKYTGNTKGERQSWIIFAVLNRIDRLPRYV